MQQSHDQAAVLAEILMKPSGVFREQVSAEIDQSLAACRESCSGVCSSIFE